MISTKQKELMELCRKLKFVLASGPRRSSKTRGCEHALCDHAWRVPNADITVLTVTQSAGIEAGVWQELTTNIIPQWIDSGMGMQWARKPYTAQVSKKPTCKVTNAYGGISKIALDSLKEEKDVEKRYKGKSYSMLYLPDLSNFKQRKTFDILSECLRGDWADDQYLFLADTNPADDGEDSWIYILWYLTRKQTYEEYALMCDKLRMRRLPIHLFENLQRKLCLLEFQIEDNPFLTQDQIDEIIARYSHDQDLYNRYILGLWVKASTDAIFADVFREAIHVVGEIETPVNKDPEIIVPEPDTFELKTGWDPGDSTNSAAALGEKWVCEMDGKLQPPIFKILDELVVVDSIHTIGDFAKSFLDKMRWWETYMERKFKYTHWSDRSVFDRREPVENRYYHQLIHEATNGEVVLQAADRSPHSVQKRVDLFKKLLFEGRVFINRDKCPWTIEMCKSMRKGTSEISCIQKGSKFKHIFDAVMYMIASESYEEITRSIADTVSTNRSANEKSGLVLVPA